MAVDRYTHKRGGLLGRPVSFVEADDASNMDTAIKAATKLVEDDRVDFLMGTFNGDVAIAVSELAKKENKRFMVTGAHIMDLTSSRCNSHPFAFMPNARMLAQAVAPPIVKAYGNKWFTVDGKAALQAMTETLKAQGGDGVGSVTMAFGATACSAPLMEAKNAKPDAVILTLYGWDSFTRGKPLGRGS